MQANLKHVFLGLILLGVLLEATADILFKKWTGNGNVWLLGVGILLYVGGTILWAASLHFEDLGKAGTVFTILNLIIIVIAGAVLFNEHLSTLNKAGIALGIASILLIEA